MIGDAQTNQVERRLRKAFCFDPPPSYDVERDDRSEQSARRDEYRGRSRLNAAVSLLEELLEQPCEPVAAERGSVAWEHVEVARGLAESLSTGRPIPRRRYSRFVAELLVIGDGTRPATLIRHGRVADPAALGAFGDLYERFLADADRTIAATGRVELGGDHVGTGVLVRLPLEDRLALVTARHVAAETSRRAANGHAAMINFSGEFRGAPANLRPIGDVIRQGSGLRLEDDWALVALGDGVDPADCPRPAELDLSGDALEAPRRLAVVSYPGRPAQVDRLRWQSGVWNRLFNGIWHVKRLSPAFVLQQPVPGPLVLHDATTTRGSSGGALLTVGTGKLGGIHCGAPDVNANWGISAARLRSEGAW